MSSKKAKHTYAMSRRRRAGIFILCLLLMAALIWFDQSCFTPYRQQRAQTSKRTETYDLEKYNTKTFAVVNVVDGDTVDIDIPDGRYDHTRIRLLGIDTPETKHPKTGVMYFGPEAAEFTSKLTLGKQVTIYLDEPNNTRGKYDRLLAYVQLPDKSFLNEVLLTEGLAYADTRFKHSFYYRYKQLEAAAKSQKKGLWLNVRSEQMPVWRQDKIKNQNP